MKSTPEQIDDAVNRFLKGEFKSLGDAEAKTGVLRQTISKRLNGSKPHKEAHPTEQKMPPAMENILIQ